eukprot:7407046-Pyramimonas_sp.AAC.1
MTPGQYAISCGCPVRSLSMFRVAAAAAADALRRVMRCWQRIPAPKCAAPSFSRVWWAGLVDDVMGCEVSKA